MNDPAGSEASLDVRLNISSPTQEAPHSALPAESLETWQDDVSGLGATAVNHVVERRARHQTAELCGGRSHNRSRD